MTPLIPALSHASTTIPVRAEEHIFHCHSGRVCRQNSKCNHVGEDIWHMIHTETNVVDLLVANQSITVLEHQISDGARTATFQTDDGSAAPSENAVDGQFLARHQFPGNYILS